MFLNHFIILASVVLDFSEPSSDGCKLELFRALRSFGLEIRDIPDLELPKSHGKQRAHITPRNVQCISFTQAGSWPLRLRGIPH